MISEQPLGTSSTMGHASATEAPFEVDIANAYLARELVRLLASDTDPPLGLLPADTPRCPLIRVLDPESLPAGPEVAAVDPRATVSPPYVILLLPHGCITEGERADFARRGAMRIVENVGALTATSVGQLVRAHAEELLALHGFLAQSPSPVGDDTLVVDHASRLWHVGEACGELLERDACAHGGGDVAAFLATELRLAYAIGLAISDEVPTRVTAFAMPDDRPMYLEFSVTSVPRTHGDSRPRACIIAVADITAGYTHKPFEKRAPIVASAVRRWGYDRMRVYRISPDGHYLVGVAEVGGHNLTREFAGYRILIHDKDHLRSAIATMSPQIIRMADIDSEKRELPVFKDLSKVTDFIMFPLARDGVVSGWATVDNGNSRKPLGATSVDEVLPAVRELEAALRATSAPEAGPVGDDPLPRILDRMAGAFTPEEMMQALLHGLRAELGIEFAHVRVRRNGHAEMVARAGSYAEQRPRLLPMDGMFWSVRAILTGERRLCQNAAVLEPDSFPETSEWTRAAEAIFQKHVGSFGVFPIAFGDTFAAAALMAPSEGFFKPDRVLIIESALRVAAIMWGDLTRDKERRAAELRKVVVQVAHSMNDPLLQAEDALRHRPDIASECDGANLGRAVHRMRQYYAMIM